jgi:glycosyltransferase involved in cell wall biosynthesis
VRVHTPHGSLQLRSARDYGFWIAEVVLAHRTDHVIAVSRSEAEQLRRRLFLGTSLTLIPNGVPRPGANADPASGLAKPLRVVHVTRFVPQKNSEMVLTILSSLRQMGALDRFHVDMLGDGPNRPALEDEARAIGLDRYLTFHGAQNSIGPYLASAFCMLTTSRWEGMPLAVLEALACGLPVVASDTPGNNDVVTSDIGRLFAAGDAPAAAAHLLELASSPETWRRLSLSAAETVRARYSVGRMSCDTLALYERLLAPREALQRRAA